MEWLGREKELRWPVETGEAVKGAEVRLECRWSPVEAPESSSTLQPIAAEDGAAGPEGVRHGTCWPIRDRWTLLTYSLLTRTPFDHFTCLCAGSSPADNFLASGDAQHQR